MSNFKFLTGAAGTGKSYNLNLKREEALKNLEDFTMTATTGIAAINLGPGTTTINSVLKFYDYLSLKTAYDKKWLQKRLGRMQGTLVIDEVSMLGASIFDLLMDAYNEAKFIQEPLKILLVGDFMQLPPVKANIGKYKNTIGFCFESEHWNQYQIERLTKIWRQSDPEFLNLMNAARSGDGESFASIVHNDDRINKLKEVDYDFEGTTIFGTNAEVEHYNSVRLSRLSTEECIIENKRWGKLLSEWREIPETVKLLKNAQVMTLANHPELKYVNGSQGHLIGWDKPNSANSLYVKLQNDEEVSVRKVIRKNYVDELYEDEVLVNKPAIPVLPDYLTETEQLKRLERYTLEDQKKRGLGKPYFDFIKEKWVVGELVYMPIRVAYALTVHKTQGLTLDTVQICPTHDFFGGPSMMYVAVSRCKTPEGLTIIGNPYRWEAMTNISEKVLNWI